MADEDLVDRVRALVEEASARAERGELWLASDACSELLEIVDATQGLLGIPDQGIDICVAVSEALLASCDLDNAAGGRDRVSCALWLRSTVQKVTKADPRERLTLLDDLIAHAAGSSDPYVAKKWAQALSRRGAVFAELQRYDDALASADEAVRIFEQVAPRDEEGIGRSQLMRSVALHRLGRHEEAFAVEDALLVSAPAHPPRGEYPLARVVLSNKTFFLLDVHRYGELLAAADRYIDEYSVDASPNELAWTGARRQLALDELVKTDAVIGARIAPASAQLLTWIRKASDPGLATWIPYCLDKQIGVALEERQSRDAVDVGEQLAGLLDRIGDPTLRMRVANRMRNPLRRLNGADQDVRGLVAPGSELRRLMELQRRVDDCDVVLERVGDSRESEASVAIAEAFSDKAEALVDLGRLRAAIEVFDDLRRWQQTKADPDVRRLAEASLERGIVACDALAALGGADAPVARRRNALWALLVKGSLQGCLRGALERERETLEAAVALTANETDMGICDLRCRALTRAAEILFSAGRDDEGLARLDDAIRSLPSHDEDGTPTHALLALGEKCTNLHRLGRSAQTVAASETLISEYREDNTLDAKRGVAAAMWLRYRALFGSSSEPSTDVDGPIAALDESLVRLGGESDTELQWRMAQALTAKVGKLLAKGDVPEAIIVSDQLRERFEGAEDEALAVGIAPWLLTSARHLGQRAPDDELRVERAARASIVLERTSPDPADVAVTGYMTTERDEQAFLLADTVVEAFAADYFESVNARLRRTVAEGQLLAIGALMRLGRRDDAESASAGLIEMGEPALEVIDEMIQPVATGPLGPMQPAMLRVMRAAILGRLDRIDEARETATDLLDNYSDSDDPLAKVIVDAAHELLDEFGAAD